MFKLETLQSLASERPRYMSKAAAIHYLNVCQRHKLGPVKGHPKLVLVQRPHWTHQAAKYEM